MFVTVNYQLDKWMSEYLHLLEQPIKEISDEIIGGVK